MDDRDALARIVWDAAEGGSEREPYSFDYLLERSNSEMGDYGEILAGVYREVDAILGSGWLAGVKAEAGAEALEALMRDSMGAFMGEVLRQRAAEIRRAASATCSCDFPAHGHTLTCPLRHVSDDARSALIRPLREHRADIAEDRLRIVRAVAAHWHADAVSHLDTDLQAHYTVAGHALSCVLAALDGKTAAGDLGMPEGWTASPNAPTDRSHE